MTRAYKPVLLAIAICVVASASSAQTDTVKRTVVPANAVINETALTLPLDQRTSYQIGMLNLIFTLQPQYGDKAVAVIRRKYSTAQVVAIGRQVQNGTLH